MESPRGRLWLMKGVNEGALTLSQTVTKHWERCIQCRACETACPSSVPYGRLIERALAQASSARKQGGIGRWLAYKVMLPRPALLRLAGRLAWLYQRSGVQALVRASGILRVLPRGFRSAEAQVPRMPFRFFRAEGRAFPAQGQRRGRVALLAGCVMPITHGPTMDATVRVLTRNGYEVVVPRAQGCCGSLHAHAGDLAAACVLARKNLRAFLDAGVDKVVTCSAGCGSTMKEYADLFRSDPASLADAQRVAGMTVDVTELLASQPDGIVPPPKALNFRVTYQDSCHLAHAQRITAAPRKLLAAIPGLTLVEMQNSTQCCGAGGAYSVTQPEIAGRVLDTKMDAVAGTKAQVICTANPGCMMQLEKGIRQRRMDARVKHVVDLLDEAYRSD
jgi:glycolate oxidase iron-sulfur subunit